MWWAWYTRETKLGDAVEIQFPVRIKGSLRRSNSSWVFLDGFPQEHLHIYFLARGVTAWK